MDERPIVNAGGVIAAFCVLFVSAAIGWTCGTVGEHRAVVAAQEELSTMANKHLDESRERDRLLSAVEYGLTKQDIDECVKACEPNGGMDRATLSKEGRGVDKCSCQNKAIFDGLALRASRPKGEEFENFMNDRCIGNGCVQWQLLERKWGE